jgi:serine/threonine protein kinase
MATGPAPIRVPPSAEALKPGRQLFGRYSILEQLGPGGMGIVLRAFDTQIGREVVLKLLPAGNSDEKSIQRFIAEARAMNLVNHPHVARVIDMAVEPWPYIVTEYYRGETLAARILQGAITAKVVARLGAQIASALVETHRVGVVHRDVKPSNVMLVLPQQELQHETPKLLDFGIAKRRGLASPTTTGGDIVK